ncbi:hypothetical protein INS49_014343 [Diaporthe citri]|uniref:uncharacterized protein n=1 Tax=Diaporthe citri TaxID=83186 RepID=UPI001C804484|nr:uncharacterized protein INS49_014343 [Diaporthe citri]KAG6358459.1 hypothetical protein INS49_014343 [Diaporthe citri]
MAARTEEKSKGYSFLIVVNKIMQNTFSSCESQVAVEFGGFVHRLLILFTEPVKRRRWWLVLRLGPEKCPDRFMTTISQRGENRCTATPSFNLEAKLPPRMVAYKVGQVILPKDVEETD